MIFKNSKTITQKSRELSKKHKQEQGKSPLHAISVKIDISRTTAFSSSFCLLQLSIIKIF